MTEASAVNECVRIVRSKWRKRPRAAIILGTGLGELVSHIEIEATFLYSALPSFQQPTAVSHKGQLVCGELAGTPILAFQGRVHYYEEFSYAQITHSVQVAAALGCELLIVSNASGGLNPQYHPGDVMVFEDHIDLMGHRNSFTLVERSPRLRPRPFYDSELATWAQEIGRRENFACHRGVYVAVTGPNYETRAEYRFMRRIGGDVVGMSTVPEVIAANQIGMRVLALSAVTNVAMPDVQDAVDALEVVSVAERSELKLRAIAIGTLQRFRK